MKVDVSPREAARVAGILLCCLIGALRIADAQTTAYSYTRIADTVTDPTAGLNGLYCVGMNNLGMVAIDSVGTGSHQIWRGDGQSFTQVAGQNAGGLCSSINDAGESAYLLYNPTTAVTSLVRNSNGILTPLARSDVSPFLSSGTTYLPSLNSSGHAVFQGGQFGGGIYVAPSGTAVYDPTNAFQPLISASTASMNDNDVVAFRAQRLPGAEVGIYRGSLTPLVESGGSVSGGTILVGLQRPVINNAGTVAFVGSLSGVYGVYTTDDGFTLTLVGTSPVDRMSINDSGSVVYRKTLSGGGGSGIYIGRPGLIDQPVVEQGQALDGSTLRDAFIWEESLNNEGQVAFWAHLADGRHGVYRANPPMTVRVTANGSDGPVTLAPGEPLVIDVLFEAPGAVLPAANVAVGVSTASGVYWLGPAGFSLSPVVVYSGPLPDFGPVTLFNIPSTAGFPPGTYQWFMIVHDPGTGTVALDIVDTVVP